MARIIRGARTQGSGYVVTIEVTEAYTDGSSRFEDVFIERSRLVGRTAAEKRQAVFEALSDSVLDELLGEEVEEPAATKEILEERAIERYEQWQRWKTTREEAEARGLANAVVNALQAREDAVWAAYLVVLNAWRQA